MVRFEIECGDYRKVIHAATPKSAWKYFTSTTKGDNRSGLLRYREVPWNGKYTWDPKEGHTRNGQWYYVNASAMDEAIKTKQRT
jgi:hypothetical protein